MTNKEVIEILLTVEEDGRNVNRNVIDALDLAIKALEFQDKVKEACCFLCGFELESYIREILKEAENEKEC